MRQFRRITGAEDPAEYFRADVRRFSLGASFGGDDPAALHVSVEPGTTFDEWGNGHWAGGSIYEWSWWGRGMEQFMMDLVSETRLAEAIIEKIEMHTTRLATATARAGIDVVCLYDDAGMQSGMQISPRLWRRFIKPAWQEAKRDD